MDMLEQVHTCFKMKRKECKELRKKVKSFKQSFDEINASHESLMENHEELGKDHTKLEKAHSSLLEEAKKEEVIVTCDVGLTCDILDEYFYKPLLLLLLTLLVALPLLPHLRVVVLLVLPH